MSVSPVFEKAEAYLNVHLRHAGPGAAIKAPGPFVTISRESGAGGSAVANALIHELSLQHQQDHWAVYSANVIDEMLVSAGLPAAVARYLPEDRVSELQSAIGEIIGLHPDLSTLMDKTNELIRRLARHGHIVMLGRGAVFVTERIPNGVHIRLVAPPAVRAERTAQWLGVTTELAAMHNQRRDAARARYVRANFSADVADASRYDLVVNTGTVTAKEAAQLIAGLVRARSPVEVPTPA